MAEITIAKHGAVKRIKSENLEEWAAMGWMKEVDYAKHIKKCLADQAAKTEEVVADKPAKPKAAKTEEVVADKPAKPKAAKTEEVVAE